MIEFILVAGILGLLFAGFKSRFVIAQNAGSAAMQEISEAIHIGSMTFLKKQYRLLGIFVIIVAILLALFIETGTAASFVFGAVASVLSGFIGMKIATLANVRTTHAAKKGIVGALQIAFSSGLVMALFASSIGLLSVTLLYTYFNDINLVFGFAFGASSVALFARVGGGIFTKAADVGADLVGKLEEHIPEDDPRNPATIADNVGDNVGDVAGMGADLFESYVGALISAMALGLLAFQTMGLWFPLQLAAAGLLASIIGSIFVRVTKAGDVHKAFEKGLWIASALTAIAAYFLLQEAFAANLTVAQNLFFIVIIGLGTGILIGWNTDRYTSEKSKYTQSIVEAAKSGAATTIIQGLVVGMRSTKNILILIAVAILLAFGLGGVYGIAIAGVAMLSTLGISLAIDAFGPVVDNAGGIAEMTHQPAKVRQVTDALDAAGNTTAAIGKGFAIGSAALTALALFSTYAATSGLSIINVIDSSILVGLFIGGMLPFYFTSMTMASVGKAALAMVQEVRRQFKTIKGLLAGKAKPDYERCVAISTENALNEMIAPGLLAVIVPFLFGILLGPAALGGLLVGTLITGVPLAILLANAGGAWDNAKKSLESKKQNTPAWHKLHDMTVIGDTVGDPFKDTSGPALNILIKLMTIVSLVSLPVIIILHADFSAWLVTIL